MKIQRQILAAFLMGLPKAHAAPFDYTALLKSAPRLSIVALFASSSRLYFAACPVSVVCMCVMASSRISRSFEQSRLMLEKNHLMESA